MAIVWRCALSVSEYAAAGKDVEVAEQACPSCGKALSWWSWYRRPVREGGSKRRVWIRRGRCRGCEVTHALLPDFVHVGRLDAVETIGRAIELTAEGVGAWRTSLELDLPFSTVRDWRTRCRRRAPRVLQRLSAVALSVGAVIAELPTRPLAAMVVVLKQVWERTRERVGGAVGELWRFWNAVCSGSALATNTSPA